MRCGIRKFTGHTAVPLRSCPYAYTHSYSDTEFSSSCVGEPGIRVARPAIATRPVENGKSDLLKRQD